MSVLIKDMKMPKKCTACEFFYYEPLLGIQRCKLTNLFIEGYSGDFPESCPLVDLPEHHLEKQDVPDTNAGDMISRQAAIDALVKVPVIFKKTDDGFDALKSTGQVYLALRQLPSVQPEYEPVTAEDFAKVMSENTLYSFMAWHAEALELIERQGFVICKKMM